MLNFNKIFGQAKILEKAIDAASVRNEIISQNIANVDTPGYKRKTVVFEERLKEALSDGSFQGQRTDERHLPIGKANIDDIKIQVRKDYSSLSYRLDGNNVDIENEMAAMAQNTIRYYTLTQSLSANFKRLKSVINEGRR